MAVPDQGRPVDDKAENYDEEYDDLFGDQESIEMDTSTTTQADTSNLKAAQVPSNALPYVKATTTRQSMFDDDSFPPKPTPCNTCAFLRTAKAKLLSEHIIQRQELRAVKKDNEELRERSGVLETLVGDGAEEQHNELIASNNELAAANNALKCDVRKAYSEVEKSKAEASKIIEDYEARKDNAVKKWHEEYAKVKKLQSLLGKMDKKHLDARDELQAKIDTLEEERDDAQREKVQYEGQYNYADAERSRLVQEVASQAQQVEYLKNKVEYLENSHGAGDRTKEYVGGKNMTWEVAKAYFKSDIETLIQQHQVKYGQGNSDIAVERDALKVEVKDLSNRLAKYPPLERIQETMKILRTAREDLGLSNQFGNPKIGQKPLAEVVPAAVSMVLEAKQELATLQDNMSKLPTLEELHDIRQQMEIVANAMGIHNEFGDVADGKKPWNEVLPAAAERVVELKTQSSDQMDQLHTLSSTINTLKEHIRELVGNALTKAELALVDGADASEYIPLSANMINELKAEKKQSEDEVGRLQGLLNVASDREQGRNDEVQRLQSELNAALKRETDHGNEVQRLQRVVSAASKGERDNINEIQRLQNELSATLEREQEYQEQVQTLTPENAKLQDETIASRNEISKLKQDIRKKDNEIENIVTKSQKRCEKITVKLSEQAETMKADLIKDHTEQQAIWKNMYQLRSDGVIARVRSEFKTKCAVWEEDKRTLKTTIETLERSLENEKQDHNKSIEKHKKYKDFANGRADELIGDYNELVDDNAELLKSEKFYMNMAIDIEDQNTELRAKLEQAKSEPSANKNKPEEVNSQKEGEADVAEASLALSPMPSDSTAPSPSEPGGSIPEIVLQETEPKLAVSNSAYLGSADSPSTNIPAVVLSIATPFPAPSPSAGSPPAIPESLSPTPIIFQASSSPIIKILASTESTNRAQESSDGTNETSESSESNIEFEQQKIATTGPANVILTTKPSAFSRKSLSAAQLFVFCSVTLAIILGVLGLWKLVVPGLTLPPGLRPISAPTPSVTGTPVQTPRPTLTLPHDLQKFPENTSTTNHIAFDSSSSSELLTTMTPTSDKLFGTQTGTSSTTPTSIATGTILNSPDNKSLSLSHALDFAMEIFSTTRALLHSKVEILHRSIVRFLSVQWSRHIIFFRLLADVRDYFFA